jgi:hypothetical protein
MIIMFITFIILAILSFKLGVYSVLFAVLKAALATLFFLTGGFMLYALWKWSTGRQKPTLGR